MKQYQEIRGTEPLELKKLNDQLRLLWSKVTHINEKDINPGVIHEIHFDSEVSDTLSLAKLTAVELETEKAKIADLEANKASIEQLDVERARIELLESKKASIEQLDVERARITRLESSKADIDDLTAQIGRIDELYSNVGNINTILSQRVFAELAEIGEIRAGSAIIADGAIGSSQISSLSVDKLEAGDISTAKFRVIGSDGRLQIQDNLLQVFDGATNLFERIALGDVNNDGSVYGLRIRGADGETILFDENGLTKEGFTDGYNKLGTNSLDPDKINIERVISRINDSTETFKSSKVLIDNETLDVKFSTIVTDLTNQGQEISNHTAQITALNGAIALKLDSQDFNTYTSALDGEIQTITTNLSKATTDIAALQGEIVLKVEQTDIETAKALLRDEISVVDTKIDTKAAELNVTLNGISARVESTESSLDGKANKVSLISEINLSPEEIQINANRIKIGMGTTFEQGQKYTWEQYVGSTWCVLADIVVDPYMLWDEMTGNIYIWKMVVSNGVPSIYLTLNGTAEDGNKYVIQDDVTGITYKWSMALSNGVPSIRLTEVPTGTPDSPIENEYIVVDDVTGVTYEWSFKLSNQVLKIQFKEVIQNG